MSLTEGICLALIATGLAYTGGILAIIREAQKGRRHEIEGPDSWRSAATPSTINHPGLDPLEDTRGPRECREIVPAGDCSPTLTGTRLDSTGSSAVGSSREGRETSSPSSPDGTVFSSGAVRVFPSSERSPQHGR